MLIFGLTHIANYLDAETEADLIAQIDMGAWCYDLRRRTQHYGFRYDYRARSASEDSYLGPLPDWIARVTDQLKRELEIAHPHDQVIINEYLPGQGIAPHIDCPKSFADPIISLSLGSGCEMEFSRGSNVQRVYLESGSLLRLSGEARYFWRHGIRPRKSDTIDGERRPRERRLSMTFRWLNKQH